jgi:transposase InsO family protein
VLGLMHSDVCGPMKTLSLDGARYFLTFIDDFSRKVWVYPLKAKSEYFDQFKEFKALVEKEAECPIQDLRSDNGGEYTSNQFEAYLKAQGIMYQTSTPHTL